MPRIRRERIPAALMLHLLQRVRQREIGMTVCGEGELVKAFLRLGKVADGEEVA